MAQRFLQLAEEMLRISDTSASCRNRWATLTPPLAPPRRRNVIILETCRRGLARCPHLCTFEGRLAPACCKMLPRRPMAAPGRRVSAYGQQGVP